MKLHEYGKWTMAHVWKHIYEDPRVIYAPGEYKFFKNHISRTEVGAELSKLYHVGIVYWLLNDEVITYEAA